MTRGKFTYQEIMSQGEIWQHTLDAIDPFPSQINELLQKSWSEAIFTGCGSTYYLSISAAALWNLLTDITSRAMPASEVWLFPGLIEMDKEILCIAVSRSGDTSETVQAIKNFTEKSKGDVFSITCCGDCELSNYSQYALVAEKAEEVSIAQTRSFTSMLLLAQYSAAVASNRSNFIEELHRLPECFNRITSAYESIAKEIAYNKKLQHFVFLGSGFYYGLANEAMLKMKEMSLSVSEAFHFLEFRHGPKSMVTPATQIIGMINDNTRDYELSVLEEMRNLGASVLVIDETGDSMQMENVVELHSGVSTLARGPLMLVIPQLIAYHRSMNNGLNPDRPKNLDAVVKI